MLNLFRIAAKLIQDATPFAMVTLLKTDGSAPQETGAKMLVTSDGRVEGTVGGGKLEAKVEQFALELLRDARSAPQIVEWNLQTDVKMTCGGVVTLLFEPHGVKPFRIVIFGAGHVGQALVRVLTVSPTCHVLCIDPREEWLRELPEAALLKKIQAESWESLPGFVSQLRESDFVLCMTQGHSRDRPILEEILRQGRRFPFLGVIGSQAKRKKIIRELIDSGIPGDKAKGFVCPIGELDVDGQPVGTSEPAHIAWTVATQLLRVHTAGSSAGPAT